MRAARVSYALDAEAAAHPNPLDCRRIVRSLAQRKRYRYVQPEVRAVEDGYMVVSPCCSRNVNPDGGFIDIARMAHTRNGDWLLYAKDHAIGQWVERAQFGRLVDAIQYLNEDTERVFWP